MKELFKNNYYTTDNKVKMVLDKKEYELLKQFVEKAEILLDNIDLKCYNELCLKSALKYKQVIELTNKYFLVIKK